MTCAVFCQNINGLSELVVRVTVRVLCRKRSLKARVLARRRPRSSCKKNQRCVTYDTLGSSKPLYLQGMEEACYGKLQHACNSGSRCRLPSSVVRFRLRVSEDGRTLNPAGALRLPFAPRHLYPRRQSLRPQEICARRLPIAGPRPTAAPRPSLRQTGGKPPWVSLSFGTQYSTSH